MQPIPDDATRELQLTTPDPLNPNTPLTNDFTLAYVRGLALARGAERFVAPNPDEAGFFFSQHFDNYYTAAQVQVFIGDIFLDELQVIQFGDQSNEIPIHGYSSRFVDAIGLGKSLVQGQLVINWISDGYLYMILRDYKNRILRDPTILDPEVARANQVAEEILKSEAIIDGFRRSNAANYQQAKQDIMATLVLAEGQNGAQVIDALKRKSRLYTTRRILPNKGYLNPVYGLQGDSSNIGITFDMRVKIGEGDQAGFRLLSGVRLLSNEMILDQSGSPLSEAYGFFARLLR